MHGIGYNKDYFKGKIDYISWDLVFKKSHSSGDYKIGMLNDMREAVFLASLYRFKKTFDLSDRKVQAVQDILIDQKRWVESYASDQVDYMLFTETVPLAIVPSSYMRIIFREQESDRFAFSIPEQGSLISIENCVISKASKKKEIANEFINFLISPEAVALNCNRYGLYPVNVKAYKFLDKDLFGRLGFPPSDEVIEKSDILKNDIPMRRLEDLWIAVKAS
jgi:spermidine/putrescine transport system substrate-binding protein